MLNILRQLSSTHDNGQSMAIYPSCIKHAPSVVIDSWQGSEHGYSSLRYETWTFSCHRLLTTVRALYYIPKVWIIHGNICLVYKTCYGTCHRLTTTVRARWYIHKVWNMLRQLSSSKNNGQSMVLYPFGMNHAPSVVIVSWQRSEHGNISLRYEPCSVSCYHLMTAVRAC